MRLYLVSPRDRVGSSHPAERSTAATVRVREIGGCFVPRDEGAVRTKAR